MIDRRSAVHVREGIWPHLSHICPMIRLTLLLALVWPGSGRPRKGYTPHPDVELYSVHFPVSVEGA